VAGLAQRLLHRLKRPVIGVQGGLDLRRRSS
jgi:hypothetical protein